MMKFYYTKFGKIDLGVEGGCLLLTALIRNFMKAVSKNLNFRHAIMRMRLRESELRIHFLFALQLTVEFLESRGEWSHLIIVRPDKDNFECAISWLLIQTSDKGMEIKSTRKKLLKMETSVRWKCTYSTFYWKLRFGTWITLALSYRFVSFFKLP